MNTRIQVEHPVTELVYGVDLVREQLRIAQGLPMRLPAGPLAPRGWALECRITSEDPANGFLPATGRIDYLRVPAGPGVRWDGGFEAGNEVTLYYDSLLGKIIVWARDRAEAIGRMGRALEELVVDRGRDQPGVPPAAARRSRVPAPARSTASSSTAGRTCWSRAGRSGSDARASRWRRRWRRTRRGRRRQPGGRRRVERPVSELRVARRRRREVAGAG